MSPIQVRARIGECRRGILRHQQESLRGEARLRDDVRHLWSAGTHRKGASWVAGVRIRKPSGRKERATGNLAEVASALGQTRHVRSAHETFDFPVPFLRPEEKDLVFLNGTTGGISEIVLAKFVFRTGGAAGLEEGVVCVQLIVAAGIENAAVEIILSGFGNEVDRRSGHEAKLGAVGVALNLEFLNGFGGRIDENGALRASVIVIGAIDEPLIAIGRAAADGKVRRTLDAFFPRTESLGGGHTRHQCDQLHEVAAVKWQLGDLAGPNKAGQFAIGGLHGDGGSLHGHRFVDGADLECDVHYRAVIDVQLDACLRLALEPRVGDVDAVGA